MEFRNKRGETGFASWNANANLATIVALVACNKRGVLLSTRRRQNFSAHALAVVMATSG